jgi:hypothetical protein
MQFEEIDKECCLICMFYSRLLLFFYGDTGDSGVTDRIDHIATFVKSIPVTS